MKGSPGAAQGAVATAIRNGSLVRPVACSECDKIAPIQAHHDDYHHPLDVRWMCRRCHAQHHARSPRVPRAAEDSTVSCRITSDNKLWLEAQKIHPRETIDDVITRLRETKQQPKVKVAVK